MRLPDYLGVVGALIVGAVLSAVLLISTLGTQPTLPTKPPQTVPPLPTPTEIGSLPSAVPTVTPVGSSGGGTAIGQVAPPIEVTLTDGSLMNTTDFAGLPLWVTFVATWCPQCHDELPMMQRFQGQLTDKMTLLVIDVGEDPKTVKKFMSDLNVDLTVGLDPDGTIQAQWGANALPVHFMLDGDGVVQQIVYGGAPEQVFIQAITAVVPDFSATE